MQFSSDPFLNNAIILTTLFAVLTITFGLIVGAVSLGAAAVCLACIVGPLAALLIEGAQK
jgi:hypothetical protein